jgi:hypothetical protein
MQRNNTGYLQAAAAVAALCFTGAAAAMQAESPPAAPAAALPSPGVGAGDLLVAPTRVELNGFRGTEVYLNNIGSAKATYRISLEFRRMTEDGQLVEVDPAQITAGEKLAYDIIRYAPRRVTLEPNQPQSIRIGVRPPDGVELPDGEYRIHMLFRAIPESRSVAEAPAPTDGIAIDLRPIYGVTIPVIVRLGKLAAQAAIADPRLVTFEGRPAVSLDLTRTGARSLYGDLRVRKPGHKDPIAEIRGVAIYTEVGKRSVTIPVAEGFTGSLAGSATIEYAERSADGAGQILTKAEVELR